MPAVRVSLPHCVVAGVSPTWEDVREELGVAGDFAPEVRAEADRAARAPNMPDLDRTDLPLLTVDPAGSRDLDQAMAIERRPGGYRVHYAIADVAAFVAPGGALDAEAHRRGVTIYAPDRNVEAALASAGVGLADVVQTQLFVTDISRWEEVGRAHRELFGEIRPVTAMVGVAALIDPAMLVEVQAVAYRAEA